MFFKDAVAAELELVASRLLELHERAIAQVRREYRCTCARDPPQLPMSMYNINPVRLASPRGDECESLVVAIPPVGAGEVKAEKEKTSANEEAPPSLQAGDIGDRTSSALSINFENSSETKVQKQYAVVHIDCAYNVRDADHMLGQGSSDPYCICKVIQKAAAWEFQTQTASNNLNPVWNHAEEFALDEDASEYILEFVVMDEDIGKSDDFLGKACLPLASCYPKGFNSCLPLDEFGEAQLQVSIEFVSDDCEQVIEMMARSREQWMVGDQQRQLTMGYDESSQLVDSFAQRRVHDKMKGTGVLDRSVFAPNATIRLAWDAVSLCFILFDAFTVPAIFAFEVKPTTRMLIANGIVTFFWTCDIVANFFTGFDEHGVVETRFRWVARKYMKGWFAVDLLVVLADWVFIAAAIGTRNITSPGNKLAKASRASSAIKMISMLRATKISMYVPDLFHKYSETATIVSHMAERLMCIMMLTHCICCIWYGLGVADSETITWVQQRGIKSDSFGLRYVISLDWALAQFTPSPTDTHPQNFRERVFKICVDFCGLVTFTAFVSTITNRMSRLRVLTAQKVEGTMVLWRYFAENRVPIDLCRRVLKAVTAREREQASLQTCERVLAVLQFLPERLLQELRVEVKMPHCLAHPFFKLLHVCDTVAVYEACHRFMQESVVLRGHEIFLRGVRAKHMIFITKGCIVYRLRGTSVKVEQGGWLSEASIWINGWIHRGDALAPKLGQVMHLDAIQFRSLMMSRLSWPDLYPKGADKFIKAYVGGFIEVGEAHNSGHLSCSDMWGEAEQLSNHCCNAFCSSGQLDVSDGSNRARISYFLRKQIMERALSLRSVSNRSNPRH